MKKITILSLILTLVLTLAACSGQELTATETAFTAVETGAVADSLPVGEEAAGDDDATTIRLNGNSISVDGGGATVDGATVTVTAAGTYSLSGTLDDGQVIVNAGDEDKVKLLLNGVNLTGSVAPLVIANAEKVVITLADGTENFVTDSAASVFDTDTAVADAPNAAIFSADDLTINGEGMLTVAGNANHGIASNDDLKITGGVITVNAVKDGLKGKDSLIVKDGVITVTAGGDGLQAHNDSDAEKGYVTLEGGTLNITAGLDGIQAETDVLVSGGEVTLTTGGGSGNSSLLDGWGLWGNGNDAASSAKGLKAGVDVTLSGGVISIDSSDDAIHSNDSVTLDGGTILLASGDDGIHADAALTINGGELIISQAYEGLESAVITLNDGDIQLTASDDGINVAGGNDGSSLNGRPGQNEFAASDEVRLTINGGTTVVDAAGDGLDSNGFIEMTGGLVIVNGPTDNGNGPLDYNGEFNISGGTLIAAGSAGMAQAPSASSTQYSVLQNFASTQAAGTLVHIETAAGEEILSFAPGKEYQSLLLSSAKLENGATYVVYTGGSSTGVAADGLYPDGSYTAGEEATRFTISSIVTGESRGGPGGGGRPGPQ